jgi:sulfur carrier protein ThiS
MRSNRRRNWLIKRIALGLAIAAFAAPVAQAKVDEGSSSGPQVVTASDYGMPRAMPSDYALASGDYIEVVRAQPKPSSVDKIELVRVEQPRSTGDNFVAADYGMPRAMPNDYALASGDQIEVVRGLPQNTSSDKIEFVRTQPRSIGEPQVVAAGFDWKDAGIGAGFALALVLLGGGAALVSRHAGRAQTA